MNGWCKLELQFFPLFKKMTLRKLQFQWKKKKKTKEIFTVLKNRVDLLLLSYQRTPN